MGPESHQTPAIVPSTEALPIDVLRQEYTIDTPESVTFGFDMAGIGSRFIGALVDTLLVALLLLVLNFVLFFLLSLTGDRGLLEFGFVDQVGWMAGFLVALYVLLQFVLFWGYHFFFEMAWNGQTPGKRVARTRVVRMDGNPAGFVEIAVRNLVRIIDFMPSLYAAGFVTMLFNDSARRLGDFAAGTMVVRAQAAIRLETLGAPPEDAATRPPARIDPADEPASLVGADLRRLTYADITLVRDALARELTGALPFPTLHRLAELMAAKVGAPIPAAVRAETRRFLIDLADAYDRRGVRLPAYL